MRMIGIDPSFRNFGLAVLVDGQFTELRTAEFLDQVNYIQTSGLFRDSVFVVEDPSEDKTVFGMIGRIKAVSMRFAGKVTEMYGIKQTAATWPDVESECRKALKVAQDIGRNKACAELFLQMLDRAKVPYVTIRPSDRHRADKDGKRLGVAGIRALSMPTKTTAEQFRDLTGCGLRSNEHSRDAATLVWGKTEKWFEFQRQIQKR
jgi:hypothetical protein